jgi:hypothetical protein
MGVTQVSIGQESCSNNSTAAEEICEILCKMINEHEYNEQQLYNCNKTAIYYRMLPTKSLDINKSANKQGIKMGKERVTSQKQIFVKLPILFMTNDLQAWVCKDDETPVDVYKDDEEIAAEVLNHRRAEHLLEDDSENEQTCELETPKISKVLDSASKVMNLMERPSDCDHLHLLHLQNFKM